MRRLTLKQKKFVKAYVETGNGTQAVLQAYNTTPLVARTIASQNLTKLNIQEEIKRVLEKNNLSLEQITKNISNIANHDIETRVSADTILRANEMAAKLSNAFPAARTQHTTLAVKTELSSLDYQELIRRNKEINKELEEIIS